MKACAVINDPTAGGNDLYKAVGHSSINGHEAIDCNLCSSHYLTKLIANEKILFILSIGVWFRYEWDQEADIPKICRLIL